MIRMDSAFNLDSPYRRHRSSSSSSIASLRRIFSASFFRWSAIFSTGFGSVDSSSGPAIPFHSHAASVKDVNSRINSASSSANWKGKRFHRSPCRARHPDSPVDCSDISLKTVDSSSDPPRAALDTANRAVTGERPRTSSISSRTPGWGFLISVSAEISSMAEPSLAGGGIHLCPGRTGRTLLLATGTCLREPDILSSESRRIRLLWRPMTSRTRMKVSPRFLGHPAENSILTILSPFSGKDIEASAAPFIRAARSSEKGPPGPFASKSIGGRNNPGRSAWMERRRCLLAPKARSTSPVAVRRTPDTRFPLSHGAAWVTAALRER